ncbi:serine hydrolase domain-containing protein [Flavilitoribacter nigricans]|nr:serine hydrolase [Flavilitoribacter nigricans]
MKTLFQGFFLLLLLSTATAQAQTFPGEEWTFNETPEQDGWDRDKGRDLFRYLVDSTHITGMVVVHKGQIVFDYGDIVENSYIASCRKSVLAMLYGRYVENGQIDLSKSLADLGIDDVTPLLPREKEATVQDLISARSGIFLKASNPGDFLEFAPKRGVEKPGNYWLYNNWDFNSAGYIFESQTGKDIHDEVTVQLAEPLRMQDWDHSLQRKSGNLEVSRFPAYHMWFSTRDMARIGLLMLNRGNWDGQQIISESWIDEMLKQRTTYQEVNNNVPIFHGTGVDFGYGYMWWLWENVKDERLKNAYSAMGAMGQSITVYPEMDVVVAYKTKSAYRRVNSQQVRLDILKKVAELYQPE